MSTDRHDSKNSASGVWDLSLGAAISGFIIVLLFALAVFFSLPAQACACVAEPAGAVPAMGLAQ